MLWECLKVAYAFFEFFFKYIAKPSLLVEKVFSEQQDTPSRVPSHVAVVYTKKSEICVTALADLIVRCACAGVKKLSVYDPWSYLRSNKIVIEKLVKSKKPKLQRDIIDIHLSEPSESCKIRNDVLDVVLLGKESGKEALVRNCRKVCFQHSENAINTKLISSYLAKDCLTEPDLLLKVGPLSSMAGYLPWALRITEIVTVPHLLKHVSFNQFVSFIDTYYKRDRRLGR
uniref:ditrans,polycis-polyprenyl diphosphate synthase [(2E,6E)-farnesyldiphosphate specific] n=1 Tax=Syphacia muris TaxID=451379 RepID=A0A0N5AG45_9BILA